MFNDAYLIRKIVDSEGKILFDHKKFADTGLLRGDGLPDDGYDEQRDRIRHGERSEK